MAHPTFTVTQILDSNQALAVVARRLREDCKYSKSIPPEMRQLRRINALAHPRIGLGETVDETIARKETDVLNVINGDPVLATYFANHDFRSMLDSLKNLTRGKPESRLAWASAPYELLSCTLVGLAVQTIYTQSRSLPLSMGRDDWDEAEQAIATLIKLENEHGLKLWKAFRTEDGGFVFDWAEQFLQRVKRTRQLAKKPHSDKSASDREAVRRFVENLLIEFNEAPPVLVEKFAALIDYNPKAASQKLASWIEIFKSDTLL